MLEIKTFVFNPLMENTYVLFDETKECVIVDPGCYHPWEKDELSNFIAGNKLRPVKLLNTHCHIDHVLGNYYCKNKFALKLYGHRKDVETLRAVKVYAPAYGIAGYEETTMDEFVEEGDEVTFGSTKLEVLFVPGHAPGHIAFFARKEKKLIAGDVLFRQSIGRTDMPGGDFDTLMDSIKNKIFPLGDEVEVFPGHGGTTTVGYEKMHNPFCGLAAGYR